MNPFHHNPMSRTQVAMQHAVSVGAHGSSPTRRDPPVGTVPGPYRPVAGGPPAQAPWHCAEHCFQKFPGSWQFAEYQDCLDTCYGEWPPRRLKWGPGPQPAPGGIPKLPAGCCVDIASKRLVCPGHSLDGRPVILHASTGSVWVDGTRIIVVELDGKGYWAPVCPVQLADKPRPVHPTVDPCMAKCTGGKLHLMGYCWRKCRGVVKAAPAPSPPSPDRLASRAFRYLPTGAAP